MIKHRKFSGFMEPLLVDINIYKKKAARECLQMAFEYVITKSQPFYELVKKEDFFNAGKVLAQLLLIMREEPFNYVAQYLYSRKTFPLNTVATLALRGNMQPEPGDDDAFYSINMLIKLHNQNNSTESNLLTVMLKDESYLRIKNCWRDIKAFVPTSNS